MGTTYTPQKFQQSDYNFTSDYSIVIDHPISEVFPVLGHGDKMKEVVLLYDSCPEYVYLECNRVPKPSWEPTPPANFTPSAPALPEGDPQPSIPRQMFRLYEEVHIFPGLTKRIEINGAQVWDDDAKVVLYESSTEMGVHVWKLRKFEEIDGDNGKKVTKVTENIYGKCSWWLKSIVQSETRRGHR